MFRLHVCGLFFIGRVMMSMSNLFLLGINVGALLVIGTAYGALRLVEYLEGRPSDKE